MNKIIATKVKPLSFLSLLALLGTQACATGGGDVDCELLSHTGVQQFELTISETEAPAQTSLQLCVIADNYEGCDNLEASGEEGVYFVEYDKPLTFVRNVSLRSTAKVAESDPVMVDASKGGKVVPAKATPGVTVPSLDSAKRAGPVFIKAKPQASHVDIQIAAIGDDVNDVVIVAAIDSATLGTVVEARPQQLGAELASCQ